VTQADAFNTNNQAGLAIARYQRAQIALRDFQKIYPTWNVKIVSYRSKYLAERVAALSKPTPPTESDTATTPPSSRPDTKAAAAMVQPPQAAKVKPDRLVGAELAPPRGRPRSAPTSETLAVRDLMWESAGLFRTREGLADAVGRLDAAYAWDLERLERSSRFCVDDWRRFNLVSVARLIARAALRREESRGGHFRADFPARDDLHWKVHLVDQRDSYGQ